MNLAAIRAVTPADEAALLALNNAHAMQTSMLDADGLRAMLGMAFMAATIGDAEAVLIAFDQDAAYGSVNFRWFRDRMERFVYIDRIITSEPARGRGHARLLYRELFARSLAAGHRRMVCEVNSEPPNPVSDNFHSSLGFEEIGRASIAGGSKQVRYLSRSLDL